MTSRPQSTLPASMYSMAGDDSGAGDGPAVRADNAGTGGRLAGPSGLPTVAAPAAPTAPTQVIAFEGSRRIGEGSLAEVALLVKKAVDAGAQSTVQVFDSATSEPIELDLTGSPHDVLARLPAPAANSAQATAAQVTAAWDASAAAPASAVAVTRRGPGRPRLGVVAREVTLLPRHWEWLASQPGGASVSLRKLVEAARQQDEEIDRKRQAQEVAWRFMQAVGSNLPGYDEASRALFATDATAFETQIGAWPADVREHAQRLASAAFAQSESQSGSPT